MRAEQVWLWGHVAGAHDGVGGGGRRSTLAPAQACRSLGVRNLVMVALGGEPAPPLVAYARELSGLDRVVWSVLSDARPPRDDLHAVLSILDTCPCLVGGIVDDTMAEGRVPPAVLARVADGLHAARRRPDLWGVVYDHELARLTPARLEACDVLTLWTGTARDLGHLGDDLARFATLTPDKRRLLGVYLWDFPAGRPMSPEAVTRALDLGATATDRGILDGMVLLASSLCGMGLESEAAASAWVRAFV